MVDRRKKIKIQQQITINPIVIEEIAKRFDQVLIRMGAVSCLSLGFTSDINLKCDSTYDSASLLVFLNEVKFKGLIGL